MKKSKITSALTVSAMTLLCHSWSAVAGDVAAADSQLEPQAVQQHVDRARELAGDSFMQTTVTFQCTVNDLAMAILHAPSTPVPSKVFDNLYYVGLSSVASWALQTSDGIILIDALNTTDEAINVIEPGLRELGLDPADVKYIVVTQGHGDHYGGAQHFVENYGTKVLMSKADWEIANNPPSMPSRPGRPAPNWGKAPAKDMVATDGYKLTLGDTTIQLVLTPGHSPGTLSVLLPVRESGQEHLAGLWGGAGFPRDNQSLDQYVESADKFSDISTQQGVDVIISNHPFIDDTLERMEILKQSPEAANPFVIGKDTAAKYSMLIAECARAEVARRQVDIAGEDSGE